MEWKARPGCDFLRMRLYCVRPQGSLRRCRALLLPRQRLCAERRLQCEEDRPWERFASAQKKSMRCTPAQQGLMRKRRGRILFSTWLRYSLQYRSTRLLMIARLSAQNFFVRMLMPNLSARSAARASPVEASSSLYAGTNSAPRFW